MNLRNYLLRRLWIFDKTIIDIENQIRFTKFGFSYNSFIHNFVLPNVKGNIQYLTNFQNVYEMEEIIKDILISIYGHKLKSIYKKNQKLD
jgi:hypothetical protein